MIKSRHEMQVHVLGLIDQFKFPAKDMDDAERRQVLRRNLGMCLEEYVLEAHHNGWDGFSSRDMTGIWRLLDDLVTYFENR